MRIYVPSWNRYKMMEQKKGTIWNFPPELHHKFTLILHTQEQRELYKPFVPDNVEMIVSGLPLGLTQTRYWLAEFAYHSEEDTFATFDDDRHFYERYEGIKLREMQPPTYAKMLLDIESKLQDGYSLVGLSDRAGNNTTPSSYRVNTFIAGTLAFRTEDFLSIKHVDIPLRQDMHFTLDLLTKGKPNIRLYWCASGACSTKEQGGCFDYRTRELTIKTNKMLAEMYPGIVTVLPGGEKTRTSWRKAYEYGVSKTKGIL